jgi:hypothetical protein
MENKTIYVCNLNYKIGMYQITHEQPQVTLVKFT